MESPLPVLESPQFQELGLHESLESVSAYRKILHAEAEANADEEVVLARVVGYLLLELHARRHVLGNKPYERIVDELVSPTRPIDNEDELVFECGQRYRDILIRGFRTSTKQYPPPSSHPSRPSYDNLLDSIKESLKPTGKDYKTARNKVFARDGYRCVITGLIDRASMKSIAELRRENERLRSAPIGVIACHILNESTTRGIGASEAVVNETHHAAGIMSILRMFGLVDLATALEKVNGVHGVWNMLSLESNSHTFFDRLDLWFEGTSTRHRYKVRVSYGGIEGFIRRISIRSGDPLVVEFRSDLKNAPPPDPQLLALHAACARVAHMSGAAEFFDELERDVEETEVLAFDGSSARLLSNLMSPHALIPGVE